jgi:SAM-dependent methyltransferase
MSTNDAELNVPVGVDVTRASTARVYDALLGGKDNYEVDRVVARDLKAAMPEVADGAIANRSFLVRVCRFLAREAGITQYLDCGSGLPTAENTHQVVQRYQREAKVAYVDNDPVVLAHGRALLEEDDRTRLIDADVFDPGSVMGNESVRAHLDFAEPVAILVLSILHNYKGDRGRPAEVMREYVNAIPSGSYVAVSHLLDPEGEDTDARRAVEEVLKRGSLQGATFRTHAEIEEFFPGLELVEPGLVLAAEWWADGPRTAPLNMGERLYLGGVGRKP